MSQQPRHHYGQQHSVQYSNGQISDEYIPTQQQRAYGGYQVNFFKIDCFNYKKC